MHGAVAQLGEHLLCKQGVTGSIPVSSTIPTAQRQETDDTETVTGAGLSLEGAPTRVLLRLLFRSLTIWNDPSIEVEYGFDKRRTVFFIHVPQTFWGYMVKRISAYGGCLGGKRR
jgi:hypothetical protein